MVHLPGVFRQRHQVLGTKIKPGEGQEPAKRASIIGGLGGLHPRRFLKILDAQISIYSYRCHLGKRKSRTVVELKKTKKRMKLAHDYYTCWRQETPIGQKTPFQLYLLKCMLML